MRNLRSSIFIAALLITSSLAAQRPTGPPAHALKGGQQRLYRFEAVEHEVPYRLYVPERCDQALATPPLVVALHVSNGGEENPAWAQARREMAASM